MWKVFIIFIIALSVSPGEIMAQESVDEIDLEVVRLLSLNKEQAVAYSAIMQRRRVAFRYLKISRWEQQMAFYEETYELLKPVLTEEQYIRFLAYMDSFIEVAQDDEFIEME